MSRSTRLSLSAEWDDCDPGGIVRGPVYLRWFERGTRQLFADVGMPWEMLIGFQDVVGVPLQSVSADLRSPVRFAEPVELITVIVNWTPRSFEVEHQIHGREGVRVRGLEVRCWAVRDDSRAEGFRAEQIPEDIALLFQ